MRQKLWNDQAPFHIGSQKNPMTLIILISIALVFATFFVHQTAITLLARSIPLGAKSSHPWFYLLMLGIFAAHIVEITLYAFGFYLADNLFGLGWLEGGQAEGAMGLFYASVVFYTSLGFGDVLPNAQLRFLAGIEALNGLLLIAWSASFMFAAMNRSWHCFSGEPTDEDRPRKE